MSTKKNNTGFVIFAGKSRQKHRAGWVLAILSATTGCASLINPYVEPDYAESNTALECPARQPADLENAVTCALAWREEYRSALQGRSTFRKVTGLSLIALAGGALGHGITQSGDSGDTLTWIGIGSGSWLAGSNWLDSMPVERAYLAGERAMSCAIDAVQPLRTLPDGVGKFNKDIDDLKSAHKTLLAAQQATRLALFELRVKVPKDAEVINFMELIDKRLSSSNDVGDAALQRITEAQKLITIRNAAKHSLMSAINKISDAVDAAVLSNEPSLQQLPLLIDSLSTYNDLFRGAEVDSDEEAGDEKQSAAQKLTLESLQKIESEVRALNMAFDKLISAIAQVKIALAPLSGVAEATATAGYPATLAACGVSEDKLGAQFAVLNHESETISAKPGGRVTFVMGGGRPPYFASVLSAHIDGVVFESPRPGNPRAQISIGGGVTSGVIEIHLQDTAGANIFRKVTIDPASESAQSAKDVTACPIAGGSDIELTLEQWYVIQRMVGAGADGKPGQATRAAICEEQKERLQPHTGYIDQALLDALEKGNKLLGGIVEGAANPFERSLSITPDAVNEVKKKHCLAQATPAVFDDEFRKVIMNYVAANDDLTAVGENNDLLSQQILEAMQAELCAVPAPIRSE